MVHFSATESVSETGRPQLQRWPRGAVPGLVRLKEATKKPAEKITFWTPLETVTVRSASRANWDKAARSEYSWLALDKKTPQQLHSGKEQLRLGP